jgi:phage anti-repressor protein
MYKDTHIIINTYKHDTRDQKIMDHKIPKNENVPVSRIKHNDRIVNIIIQIIKDDVSDDVIDMMCISLKSMINTEDAFPIYIDQIFNISGYVCMSSITRKLTQTFEENADYIFRQKSPPENNGVKKYGRGGRNKKHIFISLDCAKQICMMRQNDTCRKIRKYFIALEKLVFGFIRDPDNSVLAFLRFDVNEHISLNTKSTI